MRLRIAESVASDRAKGGFEMGAIPMYDPPPARCAQCAAVLTDDDPDGDLCLDCDTAMRWREVEECEEMGIGQWDDVDEAYGKACAILVMRGEV